MTFKTQSCILCTTKGGIYLKRNLLRKYRGNRSQKEMGLKYGVSQQAWYKWENGISTPKIATMKQIEIDSGVPMEYFFSDIFTTLSFQNPQLEKSK